MCSSQAPPFTPLRYVPVLPLSRLPLPFNFRDPWDEFADSLPSGRMNILATDGHHLYLGWSRSSVAVYAISRSCGVQLIPVFAAPVEPPTMINNLRVANFPVDLGGSLLLMTGGHEHEDEPASLSVLQVPPPALVATHDDDTLYSFWQENGPIARTILLPLFSAWGLAVHRTTGRVAVSANSRQIVVLSFRVANLMAMLSGQTANLSNGETLPDTVSLRAHTIGGIHGGNIPSVAFSPCGDLLASGSLDASFALHDVKSDAFGSGRKLYQSDDSENMSDEEEWDEWVWCVHWVDGRAVCEVPPDDDVWLESDVQKLRGGSRAAGGVMYAPPPRRSFFADVLEQRIGNANERSGVVLYDDSLAPEPGTGLAEVRQWNEDQFREHRVCKHDEEGCERQEQLEKEKKDGERAKRELTRCKEEESRTRKTKRRTRLRPHSDSEVTSSRGIDSRVHQSEEEREQLLVIGRQLMLYLYRVTGKKPGKTSKPFVEELHYLQIHPRIPGYEEAAFLDALEISRLSAVVLVARGLGVFVVRLLREDKRLGGGEPRLFMERAFPQRVGEDGRDRTSVMGVCVVPRGEKGCVTECYEVWIVWRDGMVEAWELSRGEVAVDPSVIV